MALIQSGQAQPSRWRYLAELPFIPVVNDWLELLASLLAQPLMFISSLIIVAETVTPGLFAWSFLDGTARTVMSLAPEIILPGCFQQAQAAQRDGKARKAGTLYALCGLFGLLTLLTFAAFLWHFAAGMANFMLFVRCGSGVAYTIILKIDKPQRRAESAQSAQAVSFAQMAEELTARLQDQVKSALSAVRSELRNEALAQSRELRTEITRLRTVQADALRNEAERLRAAQAESVNQIEQALFAQMQPALASFTAHVETQLTELRREISEIPAQAPVIAQTSTACIVSTETEPTLPAVIVPAAAQGASEKGQRIHEYVMSYRREHGKPPTLEKIMAECGVHKNTAVKYRREALEVTQ